MSTYCSRFSCYLYGYGAHRDLHSFPTRRSSDLDVLRNRVPGDLIETGVWRGGASIFMRAILHAYGITDRVVWLDRKSTRLNSSHANISYAVFCLKKKKNNSNII